MAELTPELEAALAPIANDTAQLIAVAKELRRRAEVNRNFNFAAFQNQLSNQVTIANQRITMIQAYLAVAEQDDPLTTQFGALLSLASSIRDSLISMQRVVTAIQDAINPTP